MIIFKRSKYHWYQWELLTATEKIAALITGFGGGKTHIFLRKCLHNLLERRCKDGLSRGWVIYPTYDLADEVFTYQFFELLDGLGIKYVYTKQYRKIVTRYGVISIKSLQYPERLVAANLSWVAIDEFDVANYRTAKIAYNKIIARLRGSEDSQLFITTTSEGYKMTYEIFHSGIQDSKKLIQASSEENKDYLPADYFDTLKSNYDAKMLEQYIGGQFVNIDGDRTYYNFNRNEHLELFNADSNHVYVGLDFNVNPFCAVIGQKQGNILKIVNEIRLKNANTDIFTQYLRSLYDPKNVTIFPDQSGNSRKTSATETDIHILKSRGFSVHSFETPLVVDRINLVNRLFLDGYSQRQLLVSPKCKYLMQDLDQVTYKRNTRELDKTNPELTHLSDALGYLCVGLFGIYNYRSMSIIGTGERESLQNIEKFKILGR